MLKIIIKTIAGLFIVSLSLFSVVGLFTEGWPLAVFLLICALLLTKVIFFRKKKLTDKAADQKIQELESELKKLKKDTTQKIRTKNNHINNDEKPLDDYFEQIEKSNLNDELKVGEPEEKTPTQAKSSNDSKEPKKIINKIETDSEDSVELYTMLNGVSLIWQGTTKKANIKVMGEIDAISGLITRLIIKENGDFYLDVIDQTTGEVQELNETQIFDIKVGATKYEFVDLCRKVFKLDLQELFRYANLIRESANKPQVKAKFAPILATFTYQSGSGTNRRTVAIDRYLKSASGKEYISGICQLRKERRMFTPSNIKTMLATDGYKKCHFNVWLVDVAKIDPELVG